MIVQFLVLLCGEYHSGAAYGATGRLMIDFETMSSLTHLLEEEVVLDFHISLLRTMLVMPESYTTYNTIIVFKIKTRNNLNE